MTSSITADSLVAIIKDTLLRMNLKVEHCRGQCYDGASVMSGARNGVAKQISTDEPRAVYTHALLWPCSKFKCEQLHQAMQSN